MSFSTPRGPGRVPKRHIQRFLELGLLERFVYDDGTEWLQVVDWRDVHPREWTGAIRQARWRENHDVYGRRKRRPGDPEAEVP